MISLCIQIDMQKKKTFAYPLHVLCYRPCYNVCTNIFNAISRRCRAWATTSCRWVNGTLQTHIGGLDPCPLFVQTWPSKSTANLLGKNGTVIYSDDGTEKAVQGNIFSTQVISKQFINLSKCISQQINIVSWYKIPFSCYGQLHNSKTHRTNN